MRTAPVNATGTDGSTFDALMASMPGFGSEFERTFANHAPMVLAALREIGGTDTQLRRFFDHYRDAKRLTPFGSPHTRLDAGNWTTALGRREREPDLRLYFAAEVARLGIDGALRCHLPVLAPGIAASAFHALMRTAYGVFRTSETDVAIALAYWAATYLPLPPPTGATPITADPAEVLRRVASIEALHHLPLHELLWQNIRDAAAVPDFAPVVDWLEVGPDTMAAMAATGLVLFAATQHFAALHVVTGLHWIRLLAPHCSAPVLQLMLRVFWQGVAALSGELGFPSLPDPDTVERWRRLPVPDWPEIRAAAAASFDEHDISLVFSAGAEMAVYGDPLYRVAAARRVGLIGDYAR